MDIEDGDELMINDETRQEEEDYSCNEWFYALSPEEQGKNLQQTSWFLELPLKEQEEHLKILGVSSSFASSDQCFAVKTNNKSMSAVFFDEDSAEIYMTSVSEQEGYEATITSFHDIVSAYKFLHPSTPLPAAHPIHQINIGRFRGGEVIDTVSQAILRR